MYEGQYSGGRRHGRGKHTLPTGEEYEGEWAADRRQGEGRCVAQNGDEYEGGWQQGKKEGHGRMRWAHGDVYEGGWRRDRMLGSWLSTPQGARGGLRSSPRSVAELTRVRFQPAGTAKAR